MINTLSLWFSSLVEAFSVLRWCSWSMRLLVSVRLFSSTDWSWFFSSVSWLIEAGMLIFIKRNQNTFPHLDSNSHQPSGERWRACHVHSQSESRVLLLQLCFSSCFFWVTTTPVTGGGQRLSQVKLLQQNSFSFNLPVISHQLEYNSIPEDRKHLFVHRQQSPPFQETYQTVAS